MMPDDGSFRTVFHESGDKFFPLASPLGPPIHHTPMDYTMVVLVAALGVGVLVGNVWAVAMLIAARIKEGGHGSRGE